MFKLLSFQPCFYLPFKIPLRSLFVLHDEKPNIYGLFSRESNELMELIEIKTFYSPNTNFTYFDLNFPLNKFEPKHVFLYRSLLGSPTIIGDNFFHIFFPISYEKL